MARVCDICGKRPITGWNPQSVGMNRKRALRRWLPNLQPMTLTPRRQGHEGQGLQPLPPHRPEGLTLRS